MSAVLGVLRADDDHIRGLAVRKHGFGRIVTLEVRGAVGFPTDKVDPAGDRVGPGDEGETVGHLGGNPRVGPGTGSTTTEGQGKTTHGR